MNNKIFLSKIRKLQNDVKIDRNARGRIRKYHEHEMNDRCRQRNVTVGPGEYGTCGIDCKEYFQSVVKLLEKQDVIEPRDIQYIKRYIIWLFRCFMYRISYYCFYHMSQSGIRPDEGHAAQISFLNKEIRDIINLMCHFNYDREVVRELASGRDIILRLGDYFNRKNHSLCPVLRRLAILMNSALLSSRIAKQRRR